MGVKARCTRPGCGKDFDPDDQNSGDCLFHTGGPVFHEGSKSWSCCRDEPGHRPVVSFDEFLLIPGCTSGSHSLDASNPTVAPSPNAQPPAVSAEDAKLVTSFGDAKITSPTVPNGSLPPPPAPAPELKKTPPPPKVDEDDDENCDVPAGATCKRLACRDSWKGSGGGKRGRGSDDECTYHPGSPIFHEGSKGYSCCKKRVLDFDDFLKLEGCKRGRHLFVGIRKLAANGVIQEELVQCRLDHYQTPSQVIVSVFGKNADKTKSTVTFESQTMTVSLALPDNKRFRKTFNLYGPIDPEASKPRFVATKLEVTLVKADARSWPALELDDAAGAGHVTFGVGGRTGTVGGKTAVYDEGNRR